MVQRIKAVADETKLLVLDEDADNYYKQRNMVVRGDMDNVDVCETPAINPFTSANTPTGYCVYATIRTQVSGRVAQCSSG